MTTVENPRELASRALVDSLKNRYPSVGFFISDSIKFVHESDKGLCVIAKKNIPKNENIIVVPHDVRFGATSKNGDLGKALINKLRKNIMQNERKYQSGRKEMQRVMIHHGEYILAVSIMKILSRKSRADVPRGVTDDISIAHAASWPSEESVLQSSWFCWDLSEAKSIWNQSGLSLILEQVQSVIRSNFDNVIFPALSSQSDEFIDTSLPSNARLDEDSASYKKEALWNTFLYALCLAWSRAHENGDDPVLIPVVELFNGHSELIDHDLKKGTPSKINVEMASGQWPFLGGGIFRNDCNLPCSALHATRDITKGEELIISYGELSPFDFMVKYGSIPDDFLRHHDILQQVSLWCPPDFIPEDRMRIACLEKNGGYPVEEFRNNNKCTLADLDRRAFEMYKTGHEPNHFGSIRHYLILAVLADGFELQRNFNTGRLRGPLYQARVLPLFCKLIDYNVALLAKDASSAEDMENARDPNTPVLQKTFYKARIVYRESLLMWRYAIAKNALSAGSDDDYLNTICVGCDLCGRTYPSMKCSRCKKVQYCSRSHQAICWRSHKSACSE